MAVELTQPPTQTIEALKGKSGKLNPEKFSSNALLHELQLGEQLNQSVQETRRADFTLMLAMLAEDVREQSQFSLPNTVEPADKMLSNIALRKQFNLPEQASLALSTPDGIKQFNQVQFIVGNDLANIHLTNAMKAKPLAFRDDKQHIEKKVLDNTSLFTQLKHRQFTQATDQSGSDCQTDKPLNPPLSFNAKAWLDGIQQSLVKSPLLN
ncbi:VC2046/SO_2500 family protein [Colwellia psychrerythraea]|uniref:Ribosomal protein S4P n=1 Tax=Colwellia psychrerythraea TaxID=28229 RepID=A0A099K9J4_COLPS|nr:VC2046/SO_2500 family protein [Colwellia psychrerythraea]KGJ87404.1 Ribosomal protein S4P [Colwellia psychrerythraea]